MQATQILKDEHRVIERGLLVLEEISRRLAQREQVDTKLVEQVLDFFGEFADRCHHGKEEDLLFPALEARGMRRDVGPIGVMLFEHEEGRAYRRQMQEAFSGVAANERARQSFYDAAHGYINLLRQHIFKEDNILFVMAEQALTKEEDAQLVESFERVERDRLGEGVHERYHHLIDGLAHQLGLVGG